MTAFRNFEQDEWPAGRVHLRRLQPADVPAFAAYRADPEVARYQSWDAYNPDEAAAFIAIYGPATIPGAPGQWRQLGIALSATNELIGDCALCLHADDPRLGEIGITLAPAHQGHGYAREALLGLLAYCFGHLQLHRVMAVTDCLNTASVRLLESVGMRREAHFRQHVWFKGAWGDEYVYAMLQAEWAARSANG